MLVSDWASACRFMGWKDSVGRRGLEGEDPQFPLISTCVPPSHILLSPSNRKPFKTPHGGAVPMLCRLNDKQGRSLYSNMDPHFIFTK